MFIFPRTFRNLAHQFTIVGPRPIDPWARGICSQQGIEGLLGFLPERRCRVQNIKRQVEYEEFSGRETSFHRSPMQDRSSDCSGRKVVSNSSASPHVQSTSWSSSGGGKGSLDRGRSNGSMHGMWPQFDLQDKHKFRFTQVDVPSNHQRRSSMVCNQISKFGCIGP